MLQLVPAANMSAPLRDSRFQFAVAAYRFWHSPCLVSLPSGGRPTDLLHYLHILEGEPRPPCNESYEPIHTVLRAGRSNISLEVWRRFFTALQPGLDGGASGVPQEDDSLTEQEVDLFTFQSELDALIRERGSVETALPRANASLRREAAQRRQDQNIRRMAWLESTIRQLKAWRRMAAGGTRVAQVAPQGVLDSMPSLAAQVEPYAPITSAVGLTNPAFANRCYLNACVQAMVRVSRLVPGWSKMMGVLGERKAQVERPFHWQLRQLYEQLHSSAQGVAAAAPVPQSTNRLRDLLRDSYQQYVHGVQEDAHACLLHLLESLQLEQENASRDQGIPQHSDYNSLLRCVIQRQWQCPACREGGIMQPEYSRHLSLHLGDEQPASSVESCLLRCVAAEELPSHRVPCACSVSTTLYKRFVGPLPEVLIMNVVRFTGGNKSHAPIRLNTYVHLPEHAGTSYRLTAIIVSTLTHTRHS